MSGVAQENFLKPRLKRRACGWWRGTTLFPVMVLWLLAIPPMAKEAFAVTDGGPDATLDASPDDASAEDGAGDASTDVAYGENDAAKKPDACIPLCVCLGNPCGSDDAST